MKIIILLAAATWLMALNAWLNAQPANELFVLVVSNDAAETISAILAAICAFAGMMLIVDIDN